ncbi:hypothetical protein ACFFV7_34125 [Nonomuraea spiralis]|uniref:Uncharacterized protein n=1 Tax=Nonomuraea spiralis TaxID=46182 RepID=A0ABV5IQI2_9ACTN|nr:hypothetical protein [Nonomuraea spiralis]GGT26844.1 hypothetical protein GCM10010176_084410 [Nonomuraea spiralis]
MRLPGSVGGWVFTVVALLGLLVFAGGGVLWLMLVVAAQAAMIVAVTKAYQDAARWQEPGDGGERG